MFAIHASRLPTASPSLAVAAMPTLLLLALR
jgi:hypothetical protein